MKTTKRIVKNYKGYSFVFIPERGRGYKVSAQGFGSYWYQDTASVREAKRRMEY